MTFSCCSTKLLFVTTQTWISRQTGAIMGATRNVGDDRLIGLHQLIAHVGSVSATVIRLRTVQLILRGRRVFVAHERPPLPAATVRFAFSNQHCPLGQSASDCSIASSEVRQVFRYAVATGRITQNPAGDLRVVPPPAEGNHFARPQTQSGWLKTL